MFLLRKYVNGVSYWSVRGQQTKGHGDIKMDLSKIMRMNRALKFENIKDRVARGNVVD
jgi:hypothetical protein